MPLVYKYGNSKRNTWYLCDHIIGKRIPKRYMDEDKYFVCHYSTSPPPYLVEKMIKDYVNEGVWPWLTLDNCEYDKFYIPSQNYDRIKKYHNGNIMFYISENAVFAYERDAIDVSLLMKTPIDSHVFDNKRFYVLTAFPFEDLYKCLSSMARHNIDFSLVTQNTE